MRATKPPFCRASRPPWRGSIKRRRALGGLSRGCRQWQLQKALRGYLNDEGAAKDSLLAFPQAIANLKTVQKLDAELQAVGDECTRFLRRYMAGGPDERPASTGLHSMA